MDGFYERLIVRAATIDELLSGEFETVAGQKGDTDLAARRLAARLHARLPRRGLERTEGDAGLFCFG